VRRGFVSRWYERLTIEHIWALAALAGGLYLFSTCTRSARTISGGIWRWAGRSSRQARSRRWIRSPTPCAGSLPILQHVLADGGLFTWSIRLGGPALVVFTHSILITSAYAIVLYLGKQISGSWRLAAFATLFAAALGLNDWNVRPQAVTFVLGALYLLAIHNLRRVGAEPGCWSSRWACWCGPTATGLSSSVLFLSGCGWRRSVAGMEKRDLEISAGREYGCPYWRFS
jgi:hypothetical protein